MAWRRRGSWAGQWKREPGGEEGRCCWSRRPLSRALSAVPGGADATAEDDMLKESTCCCVQCSHVSLMAAAAGWRARTRPGGRRLLVNLPRQNLPSNFFRRLSPPGHKPQRAALTGR